MNMFKVLPVIIFLCLAFVTYSQAQNPIRIIIRGDDMGMAHTVNVAIIDSYKNGVMKTTEILANSPWFPEAVTLLQENPGLDVGVHLTLTSEWETLRWRPLTNAPSLTDADGFFFPMIWPSQNYGPEKALISKEWKLDEIEKEFRAQIELVKRNVKQVSHLSCHMGCNGLAPEVDELVNRLAKEYDLQIDLEALGVMGGARYDGPTEKPEEKVESFVRMLENLQPGTHLFVDHPGYDTSEMKAIYHTGYENVAQDREGVTRAFIAPEVKDVLTRRGIQAISYAELKE